MYSDSQDIGQVSQNLSLRRSPERKYPPKNFSCSSNLSTAYRTRKILDDCPSICCYSTCCCHCCCCYNPCYHCCYYPCKLNYDYTSKNTSEDLKKPDENPKDNINSSLKGSNINQSNQLNEPNDKPNPPVQTENSYFSYEQNQFNDFLKKLMEVESKIEDAKINLALNPDFNCDDAFSLFEENDKGYLDENDLKNGLNFIGISPTDEEIRLLMKRFDLQKGGRITYADFFDIVVPFEKNYRMRVENRNPHYLYPWKKEDLFRPNTINELKELFNLIINLEIEVNNMRKLFGTLRLNLRNIFGQVDKNNAGHFLSDELIEYLDNNRLLVNRRDPDLLFIRLDKNRNGKIEFSEVEDELQTLY